MGFKSAASLHQKRFREDNLQLIAFDTFPHMLTDEDALKGLNFYHDFPGLMDAIKKRYKSFRRPLYKNMLRSEHIPFNFFIPLQLHIREEKVKAFLVELFPHLDIRSIEAIEIEKSPETRKYIGEASKTLPFPLERLYLDDDTSFDVLITYTSLLGKEAIGIEIKYSEKSYPYGDKERSRMFCETSDSLYHRRHLDSNVFIEDCIHKLRKKKLKQLWRNHLLGLSMVQKRDLVKFTSVHMYPSGNSYQAEAASEYRMLLRDDCKNSFIPLTFEEFIVIGDEIFYKDQIWEKWLKYLEERYLF